MKKSENYFFAGIASIILSSITFPVPVLALIISVVGLVCMINALRLQSKGL